MSSPVKPIAAVLALIAAGLAPGAAAAEPGGAAVAEPRLLTLPDCVRMALRKAEADGILDSQKALADAVRRETDAQSRPQLGVTVDGRQYTSGDEDQDFGVSVSLGEHVLEIPQNMVRRKIARQRQAIAEERTRRETQRYAVQVRKAYIRCLETRDVAALARARWTAAEDRRKALQGVSSDDPKLRRLTATAGLAADQGAVESRDAEAAAQACLKQLEQLCGLGDAPFTVEELPGYQFPPIELSDCFRWARGHRSDLAALHIEREVMTLAARLAGLERLPRPRLSFGYDSGESEIDDTRGNYAMLALEVPLWDAGETGARKAQALARRDALTASILQAEMEITQAVGDAFTRLRQTAHELERFRKNTEPEDVYREKEVQHRHGALSSADLAAARILREEHLARTRAANRACHEMQATLMEALQASEADLASSLRPPPEKAGTPPPP